MAPRGDAFVPLTCQRCGLCRGRTQVVPAEGGAAPVAFFVGEAPGPDEDVQGRPFVGRAGKILRRALEAAGWREEEVWITNVVKCFPHDEDHGTSRIRKPRPDEVEACRGHLEAEVRALAPRIIVALGKTALEGLTGRRWARLGDAHATVVPAHPGLGRTPVFVTYHPSGLHYGHATEAELVLDLKAARELALA